MIRKRIPRRDDGVIYQLVQKELLPFAKQTLPSARISRSLLRKRLSQGVTYVETTAGRVPVGFIALIADRERLSVDMLAVDPRYQGKGIGKRLMLYVERKAQELGLPEVTLWVDEANGRARGFYERLGYTSIYYDPHMRCFLMRKSM
ncbi:MULTISPECIES: GNAT family N-acetyltransferase [Paenibacillus]|uniref:GNAT family N-acetyltransferase n=1 Tax=Paenibacillus validus TaxID=44253 RepID=A0A7X2ZDS4_9BACL|nr:MULTISPECIES: GNAT family N-acetyltransferase [Paenibacillus]MUG72963.1 GNAT family N-acetyltransferase [Paenibacillus validus]